MIPVAISQFQYPRIVEKTEDMLDTEEGRLLWLALRKSYIGGSEAAASVGMSKYQTMYDLYLDKTNPEIIVTRDETEKMWAGRKLEPVIAEMFAEKTGKHVVRQPYFYCHPIHTFMGANIDFAIYGENAGLEIKNTTTKNVIETYYFQIMHYMAVTGADRWYLAYLSYGWKFDFVCIERDEEVIELLINGECDFWNSHVIPRIPPVEDIVEQHG